MKSEEERKISIIKAEAESESARIFNENIEKYGTAYLELKRLEGAREIISNLSRSSNVTYLPSGSMSSSASSGSQSSSPNFLFKI